MIIVLFYKLTITEHFAFSLDTFAYGSLRNYFSFITKPTFKCVKDRKQAKFHQIQLGTI